MAKIVVKMPITNLHKSISAIKIFAGVKSVIKTKTTLD